MKRTVLQIRQMDCSAEEQLIRMQLQNLDSIQDLEFDLPNRRLTVWHEGQKDQITTAVSRLNLGDTLLSSEDSDYVSTGDNATHQRRTLWWVLGINAVFFVLEMGFGLVSGSMGLVSDSLDMLADAFVYGLSLVAVGAGVARKQRVASISGYLQIALAIIGLVEVVRRFLGQGETPDFSIMISVAALALIGNAVCLWLIQRERSGDAHMEASYIFTSNDIVINGGVIAAGVLVYLLDSRIPDLVIGTFVFAIVLRGAFRILKLAR